MTSKEALKNIETLSYCKQHITIQEWCEIIKQDLDRFEEENEALKMGIESLNTDYKELKQTSEFVIEKFKISNKNLIDENEKLKKVIEILKDNVYLEFDDENNAVRFKRNKDDECDYTIIFVYDKEQYNLLKEYL